MAQSSGGRSRGKGKDGWGAWYAVPARSELLSIGLAGGSENRMASSDTLVGVQRLTAGSTRPLFQRTLPGRISSPTQVLSLVVTDFVMIAIATTLALWGRPLLGFLPDTADLDANVRPWAMTLTLAWMAALMLTGSHQPRLLGVGMAEYRRVLDASFLVAAAVGVGAYLLKYPLSRGFFVLFFLLGIPLLLTGRIALRRGLHVARRKGQFLTPTLIAGDLNHVEDLARIIRREQWLGFDVVGALPNKAPGTHTPSGIPIVGHPTDAPAALRGTRAEAVIFAEGSFPRAHMFNRMARELEDHHAQMIVVPALTDISAQRMNVRPVAGIPLVHVEKPRAQRASTWFKRAFDWVGSTLLLIVSLPLTVAVALAIKLEDGGPVFFKQARVGLKGEPFTCYKFRSMCVDAEARLAALREKNEFQGDVLFKMADDPRITRIGRFIRRFSIDEIPQFWNVWCGDMSLVGPRPALQAEVDQYDEHVLRRLDVRPGLTGLWQVSGRSDLSWEDTVRLDLYYVDNWSMMQDVAILGRTVNAVLASRGAY